MRSILARSIIAAAVSLAIGQFLMLRLDWDLSFAATVAVVLGVGVSLILIPPSKGIIG